MINVIRSNDLASLADKFYEITEGRPLSDPFSKECIVVNSPVMPAWLKQYYLYDYQSGSRHKVLANWDVQQLYVFVNDWMVKLWGAELEGERSAQDHPYSKDCLQWRLYRILSGDKCPAGIKPMIQPPGKPADPRKCMSAAGQLAQLIDEYQVYRPEMLRDWNKNSGTVGTDFAWQRDLWRALTNDECGAESYHALITRMAEKGIVGAGNAAKSELKGRYERLHVFAVTSMPAAYLYFFKQLAEITEVNFYVFNPCSDFWEHVLSDKEKARKAARSASPLEAAPDDGDESRPEDNPILASLGKAAKQYVNEIACYEGYVNDWLEGRTSDGSGTILQKIQEDISGNSTSSGFAAQACDESLKIHICHSPMREMEVLKDVIYGLLGKFGECSKEGMRSNVQPRDIQVLVSDMSKYLPYIEAVFSSKGLPCMIADRPSVMMSEIPTAFIQLVEQAHGRFEAGQMMDILAVEAVRGKFGLTADAVEQLKQVVRESGIRWGRDLDAVKDEMHDDTLTWRKGLDRIMRGYALGDVEAAPGELLHYKEVEGDSALNAGILADYFGRMEELSKKITGRVMTAEQWSEVLDSAVDGFFEVSGETYRQIVAVKKAVNALKNSAGNAGCAGQAVPFGVMLDFIKNHISSMDAEAGNLAQNAILFTDLRVMRAVPRKYIYIAGLNYGEFPRSDERPVFDEIGKKRFRVDRSQRLDDRYAFLEALMSARKAVHISYTGRSCQTNEKIPPSVIIDEIRDYFRKITGRENADALDVEHRLQAYDSDYFDGTESPAIGMQSFSRDNCAAAEKLQERLKAGSGKKKKDSGAVDKADAAILEVELSDLINFLKNPAEYYYKNVLNVRFDDNSRFVEDAEKFSRNSLDKYDLRQAAIDIYIRHDSAKHTDILMQLAQRDVIYPGTPGSLLVEEALADVKAYLASTVAGITPETSLSSLLAMDKNPVQVDELVGGRYKLTGQLELTDIGGISYQVCHRYSGVKDKDMINALVRHLVSCVKGNQGKTLLLGNDKNKVRMVNFELLPAGEAEKCLIDLLDMFRAGQKAVIPFIYTESEKFWKTYKKCFDNDEDTDVKIKNERAEKAGLKEAKSAWMSGTQVHDGGMTSKDNQYCYRAFREPGPGAFSGFVKYARTVFEMIDLCTQGEEKAASESKLPADAGTAGKKPGQKKSK